MLKVAIFGGAFNPIGKHHIEIANSLLFIFDEVWITPCYKSITGKVLEDSEHRLKMCKLAIENNGKDKIKLCEFEIKNKLFDESSIILENFLTSHSNFNRRFYFIIGIDNALTINTWKDWEKLIKLIPFVVIPRKGYNFDGYSWFTEAPHIYLKNIEENDLSSTKIRNDLMKNNTSDLLDADILKYVSDHNLYVKN